MIYVRDIIPVLSTNPTPLDSQNIFYSIFLGCNKEGADASTEIYY